MFKSDFTPLGDKYRTWCSLNSKRKSVTTGRSGLECLRLELLEDPIEKYF